MRVYTESVQFKADQKLLQFIEQKLQKMEQYFDQIIEARVVLKLENSGQVRDKIAEVRLNVAGDILIAKAKSKNFETSIHQTIGTLKRQLRKYKSKLQGKK